MTTTRSRKGRATATAPVCECGHGGALHGYSNACTECECGFYVPAAELEAAAEIDAEFYAPEVSWHDGPFRQS
jgi:hypothetical protein